jgi:hypothetical protein
MTAAILGLVALAAISLGLRTTSVWLGAAVHPVVRLGIAIAAGVLIAAVVLEVAQSYRVLDLGIGLLLSLSPVGVYDLAKWWFRWRNHRPPG